MYAGVNRLSKDKGSQIVTQTAILCSSAVGGDVACVGAAKIAATDFLKSMTSASHGIVTLARLVRRRPWGGCVAWVAIMSRNAGDGGEVRSR